MSRLWTPSGPNGDRRLTRAQRDAMLSKDGLLAYTEQMILKAKADDRYHRWPDVYVHDQATADEFALAFQRRPKVRGCPIRVDPSEVDRPGVIRVYTKNEMK